MTDTLRDRLGALEQLAQMWERERPAAIRAFVRELREALAAQPAPAVMGEERHMSELLANAIEIADKGKHFKIVMTVQQHIQLAEALSAEIRRVDGNHDLGAGALGEKIADWLAPRTAAAESREEPKTGTEIMLRAAAERDKARWSDIQNRLREARRGNTEVEQFYHADVQWLVDAVTRLGHL